MHAVGDISGKYPQTFGCQTSLIIKNKIIITFYFHPSYRYNQKKMLQLCYVCPFFNFWFPWLTGLYIKSYSHFIDTSVLP